MNVDVDGQISAVSRELGDRVHEAGELLEMRISQVYPTTAEDLWEAVTDAGRIRRWFLPVSGELKVGGKYQLEGNASGTVESCDPPRAFTATWEFGGGVSWIEVGVAPEGDGARFTLVHLARVEEQMWETYGPGAVGVGWDGAFMGLGRYLASGEPNDAAEAEAWAGTEQGKLFTRLSSDAWCAASVAYGTDPEKARAAAEQTRRFYTP
ncbi:activator of HSP90 ATPase [Actinorhabdospora filicis]|uniref:Activator of HSP90 ATPase n=1 Tax=Actinorhabdospora filicis TaxID=1785913 RepID=A0A9W6W9S6_9ACTN|nr:SRPBCC family protein [Actinorhabdospora filicis]GLZ77871.1 activator of HSP90 ATPase [Actinorhabdospora filicis]